MGGGGGGGRSLFINQLCSNCMVAGVILNVEFSRNIAFFAQQIYVVVLCVCMKFWDSLFNHLSVSVSGLIVTMSEAT